MKLQRVFDHVLVRVENLSAAFREDVRREEDLFLSGCPLPHLFDLPL